MKQMKTVGKIAALMFCAVFTLGLAACAGGTVKKEYTGDKLPPPEISVPENKTEMPVYPKPPLSRPEVTPGVKPTVYDWYASSDGYTAEEQFSGDIRIAFDDAENALADWAYVGAYVADYSSDYSFFKLKFSASGVETVTVQAIYYEQYQAKYPAVTILTQRVSEGENLLAVSLNDAMIIDDSYGIVSGQYLKDKQIIGIVLFIDSNPKMATEDRVGEMSVTEAAFVDKDDEDLAILNSPPRISGFTHTGYSDAKLTLSNSASVANTKNAEFGYTAFAGTFPCFAADISGYKSDYDSVRMKLTGKNVKTVSIAISYTLGTTGQKYNFFPGAYGVILKDDVTEELEFDFSTLEELMPDFVGTVPGSYVKFLKPNQLLFFADNNLEENNSGTIRVEDIEFYTNVIEGAPKIGNWVVTGSGIEKSNTNPGGFATVTYSQTQGWNSISVGVSGYTSDYCVLEMNVRFYGAKNLGIALAYGGNNFVVQSSSGKAIPSVVQTVQTEEGIDALGAYTQYKLTFDFSQVVVTGGPLTSKTITSILLYIDAVDDSGDSLNPTPTDGDRAMVFSGIEFKKKG